MTVMLKAHIFVEQNPIHKKIETFVRAENYEIIVERENNNENVFESV